MRNFKELVIWQRSHQLVLNIYQLTSIFPKDELFGITSQLRRASVSIPNNIAEGCGRDSNPDFNRFLIISMGSASEVEYLLLLSKDLGFLEFDKYNELNIELIEIKKMLYSFIQKVKK